LCFFFLFSVHCSAPSLLYTLSLHDALPIFISAAAWTPILVYLNHRFHKSGDTHCLILIALGYYLLVTMTSPGFILMVSALLICQDRKSTRLNSSHVKISYAVFCLKKKKQYN